MKRPLKLSIKLDLPCGCVEEHTFDEGEIVYFIEREDKLLDQELFGFWINQKINKHLCVASTEDVERYLLLVVNEAYRDRTDYEEDVVRFLANMYAKKERKKIV
jgi:hypothetical protein